MKNNQMKFMNFFIDSQAAIVALGNQYVTSHAVAEAVDWLNELAEVVESVTLVWIPAHKWETRVSQRLGNEWIP